MHLSPNKPPRQQFIVVALAIAAGGLGAAAPAAAQGPAVPTPQEAAAQIDTSPAQQLTIDDALQLARKNNRDLRAARERLRISHADVERAWSAVLPKLAAQGKYTYNYPKVTFDTSSFSLTGLVIQDQVATGQYKPSADVLAALLKAQQAQQAGGATPTGSIDIVPEHQLDGILALTLPLIAPSAWAAIHGAKQAHLGQEKQLAATEAQLLQSVASAYYAAAGNDELVAARRHAIDVARQTLDNARARLEAGVVNKVEVSRAELALIQAQQRLLESEDSRASAYRVLDTLLQLRQPFKVVPASEPKIEERNDGELVQSALRLRPEIAALQAQAQAARSQAWAAGLRWAPIVSAFGNIRLTNATGFGGRNDYYAAGLQLDWQLFDGFERDAQRHTFEAQARDASLRLAQLRDTVADDILTARRQVQTKKQGLRSAQRSAQLAQETLDLVRIQHDAGTATQLDLLTAQDQLIQAEVGLAQARFDLSLSDISLRRTTGAFPGPASGG